MIIRQELREAIAPKISNCIVESLDDTSFDGKTEKNLYLSGICIQGGIRNANQRIYPVDEIAKAVRTINDQLSNDYSILGECNHPPDLQVNLDRASHMITKMWMDGPNGYGKLKILNTPMGALVRTLIESGVKLGVSSRGSGNVSDDGQNIVSDFEIITIDVVATPSGPGCFPTPIYEHLMNHTGGYRSYQLAEAVRHDPQAQKYLQHSLLNFIKTLK
jgi:hypothetical protein